MENVVNLLRCAWAGSQRYGALVWSGDIHSDWQTFRRQVCAGLNMGIAGIPWWTTDIGGFSGGNPEDEAFGRLWCAGLNGEPSVQSCVCTGTGFPGSPLTHADGSPTMPTGADNEIWSFGDANKRRSWKNIYPFPGENEAVCEGIDEGSP